MLIGLHYLNAATVDTRALKIQQWDAVASTWKSSERAKFDRLQLAVEINPPTGGSQGPKSLSSTDTCLTDVTCEPMDDLGTQPSDIVANKDFNPLVYHTTVRSAVPRRRGRLVDLKNFVYTDATRLHLQQFKLPACISVYLQ
eukprot:SAG11_NODE_5782_length_1465_cov_0.901903_2_plen_142_part_00